MARAATVRSSMHRPALVLLACLLASCSAMSVAPTSSSEIPSPSASLAPSSPGEPLPTDSSPITPSLPASAPPSGAALTGEIAYVAGVDPQIYLLDLATGVSRQLTSLLPEHAELSATRPLRPALSCGFGPWGLTWSPDGEHLAFAYGSCEGVVYTVDLDGELRRIGDGIGPAWSPDGTQLLHGVNIAYNPCGSGCLPDPVPGANDLRILDMADGGESRPFTSDGSTAFASAATWAPDGSMIAYNAPPPAGASPELFGATYVIDAGGNERRLVGSGAYPMGWHPDGRLLVRMESDSTVRAVDLETGDSVLLAPEETSTVSPDATRFVTLEFDSVTGEALAILRDATSHALASLHGHDLAWAPDSSLLAATADGSIVILGRDGSLLASYPTGAEGTFGAGAWRPEP